LGSQKDSLFMDQFLAGRLQFVADRSTHPALDRQAYVVVRAQAKARAWELVEQKFVQAEQDAFDLIHDSIKAIEGVPGGR
jgi:hypothetical protein